MFNANDNYTAINLEFNYLNLRKYLIDLYNQKQTEIEIFLTISLEKEYYEGEHLKQILLDIQKLSQNLVLSINGKDIKFKVNTIKMVVGDVLNRHRWIYRGQAKYMLEHNLTIEDTITPNIKKEIASRAYIQGKEQGFDWFKRNIESFNLLFGDKKLNKNFQLGNEITQIFDGNENCPPMYYICYEYWYKHPKYNEIQNALTKVRSLPNSIVERAYNYESEYFLRRLKNRNEIIEFENMFLKYSKDYLVDETIKNSLIYQINKFFLIELYYYGKEGKFTTVFKGKKAKNNPEILKGIQNELKYIDCRRFVTIREK